MINKLSLEFSIFIKSLKKQFKEPWVLTYHNLRESGAADGAWLFLGWFTVELVAMLVDGGHVTEARPHFHHNVTRVETQVQVTALKQLQFITG